MTTPSPKDLTINIAEDFALHGRIYPASGAASGVSGGKTPALCLPGLTRNASDFEDIAPIIAATGRDVVALSLRGRGKSDYAQDYTTYHPLVYRDDVIAAMRALDFQQALFVGTSLGGIVTMLVNAASPDLVAGAILNDIGPDLAPEGLARIAGYVGARADNADSHAALATLEEAAAAIRAINEVAFPDHDDQFWLRFAARTFRQTTEGWALDYDPGIARAFTQAPAPPDLWPPFESLKETPTLVIRGALSDLLSAEIVNAMRKVHPDFQYCEVPEIGHAPTLTEPAAANAIKAFLEAQ